MISVNCNFTWGRFGKVINNSQLGLKLKEVEELLYWLSMQNIQNSLMIIWLVDALSDKSNKVQAERIERQIETIMVNSEFHDQFLHHQPHPNH